MIETQLTHLENFSCPIAKTDEVEVITLDCIMEINCPQCLGEIYHAVSKRLRQMGEMD